MPSMNCWITFVDLKTMRYKHPSKFSRSVLVTTGQCDVGQDGPRKNGPNVENFALKYPFRLAELPIYIPWGRLMAVTQSFVF